MLTFASGNCSPTFGQIKAFPQAEGFGAQANGGRGGDVYHVTNLSDSGFGSLRYGIDNAPSSGRTIVFDVGGWINLGSKLGINHGKRNITIAGQTAPGGVGVRGNQFSVGGDDIVIRHMTFRPGKGAGRVDSAGANADANRVIYDHVSAGFSYDENFSLQATDVTLQYSTVSYGLEDHSAGSLLENARRVSMHHNLYAHNNTRNPKHRVHETLDWIDNIIYNWDNRAFFMQATDSSGFFWTSNIDGNYFIAGANQDNTKPLSGGSLDDYGTWWGVNAYDADQDSVHDGQNYARTDANFSDVSSAVTTWSNTPYPVADEIWKAGSPQAAYERVLAEFGATPWNRGEVDQLLHDDVANRTGAIISHENQLVARGISNGGFGLLGGGSAPIDTDRDGIPNAWEVKHGTNPFAANNNGDFDQDGYTDLEEYLNDLAAFAAIGPLEFSGIGRYADSKRWTNRWEPSRLDAVHINNGAAFVDAVGQKAGTLAVGQTVGGNGRLYVTSGWLEVSETMEVGGSGVGAIEHYGGDLRVLGGSLSIVNGAYNLRGGTLLAPTVNKQPAGEFEFTGGTLATQHVGFDLEIDGGQFAPAGEEAGFALVNGHLTVNTGGVAIDLGSNTTHDQIAVAGDVILGGDLEVALLGGYVPAPGTSWQILAANTITGSFATVPAGFEVQQTGTSLWLMASGLGAGVPEPGTLVIGWLAIGAVFLSRSRALCVVLLFCVSSSFHTALAVTLPAIADTQLSENGTTGNGDAISSGSGSSTAINARWNFTSNPANRNEWLALKFDLSEYPDKQRLTDVALRTYMHRSSNNNTQTLHLYALTPGIAGEDWDESSVAYGTMPGFTFDGFSNTNIIDVGGAIQDLGVFAVSGVESEGNVSLIDPNSLTSFVQGMGSSDLLTLLVSYESAGNGQWRIASRETTSSDTGVLSGPAGSFAPFLDFQIGTSGVAGDYNDDGVVNAADYSVWRDNLGGTALLNEEVSPNQVDIADYLFWRERFGATDSGQPPLSTTQGVPEPATLLLAVSLLVCDSRKRGTGGKKAH